MDSPSISGTSILKAFLLTGLCAFLIVLAIQLDMPNFQDLTDIIQLKYTEHQLETGAFSKEELLKEGWLYFNLGQYDKARQYMEKAGTGDQNISAIYCLGLIEMKYHRYESAISRFKVVAAKSPDHEATRIALGQAYYQLRFWGQAREEFERAVKIEPTNEMARLWLGKTYKNLNKPEEAISILETVSHGRESVEAAALLKGIHQELQGISTGNGKK